MSILKQVADALVTRAEEGRGRQRYASGKCQATFDPAISE